MSEAPPATILVVDDSEDNRYAVVRHLQKVGFRVMEAENGEETLRQMDKRPDLVILDVDLPDMSGFEVCQKIKSSPSNAIIPVLHLSATFTKTRHRVQGLEGDARCLPVPSGRAAGAGGNRQRPAATKTIRTGAAGREPPQGRVHRHSRPRTPQPAGPHSAPRSKFCVSAAAGPDPLARSAREIALTARSRTCRGWSTTCST